MEHEKASRKRRTREHVIADLSINHVERVILRAGFVIEVPRNDYGLDLEIYTFGTNGEVEPGLVYMQVKSTDNMSKKKRGRWISQVVDERDLRAWAEQKHPVILVIYDAQRDRAYWIDIRAFARSLGLELAEGMRAYRTIRIPVKNRFTVITMQKFAEEKNTMYQVPEGWVPYDQ